MPVIDISNLSEEELIFMIIGYGAILLIVLLLGGKK